MHSNKPNNTRGRAWDEDVERKNVRGRRWDKDCERKNARERTPEKERPRKEENVRERYSAFLPSDSNTHLTLLTWQWRDRVRLRANEQREFQNRVKKNITSVLSNNRCNIFFLLIMTHITPVKSSNRCNIWPILKKMIFFS